MLLRGAVFHEVYAADWLSTTIMRTSSFYLLCRDLQVFLQHSLQLWHWDHFHRHYRSQASRGVHQTQQKSTQGSHRAKPDTYRLSAVWKINGLPQFCHSKAKKQKRFEPVASCIGFVVQIDDAMPSECIFVLLAGVPGLWLLLLLCGVWCCNNVFGLKVSLCVRVCV